jgi:hypothetical protein
MPLPNFREKLCCLAAEWNAAAFEVSKKLEAIAIHRAFQLGPFSKPIPRWPRDHAPFYAGARVFIKL